MYAGANNTELCPTRFFTGEPLYRDGPAPDDAEIAAARRRLLAARTTTRCAAELARLQGRSTATPCCSTATASSRELPWLFEGTLPDLNLGTASGSAAAHRRCATRWRALLADADAVHRRSSTAASRAATSRATTASPPTGVHAVQLEMCWSTYMHETPPFDWRRGAPARLQPLLRAAAAHACSTGSRID